MTKDRAGSLQRMLGIPVRICFPEWAMNVCCGPELICSVHRLVPERLLVGKNYNVTIICIWLSRSVSPSVKVSKVVWHNGRLSSVACRGENVSGWWLDPRATPPADCRQHRESWCRLFPDRSYLAAVPDRCTLLAGPSSIASSSQ